MIGTFLSFDKMITPTLLKIIYFLALIAVIIVSIIAIFQGMILQGVVTLVVGPIMVRVYAELMLLFFSIYDKLCEIKKSLDKKD